MKTKRRRRGRGLYSPELLEAPTAPATILATSLLDHGDGDTTTQMDHGIEAARRSATEPLLHREARHPR